MQEPWDALKQEESMLSRTTFAKLTGHPVLLKNLYVWCLCVFLILGLRILTVSVWASLSFGDTAEINLGKKDFTN